MKTLYDLIGAHRDDDAVSLKKAYRKAVKATHPDYHADDPEAVRRFREITAAYNILRDTEQRMAYDWTLETCRAPPNATLKHTAPPRMRFLVSTMSVIAAVTMMLTGAFLLFARVSEVSIQDVVGRRVPQANATAAVPQTPITVATPSVATSIAQDGSTSEDARDGTASQETKDWTASGTQNTAPTEETKDRPALQETAPAQAGRAIHFAEHDVDMDLINRSSTPEKHNGVPSSESYGPWLAKRHRGSDIRTDARTRGPAFAETLPPANKPAPKIGSKSGDTLVESKPDSFRLGPLCLSLNSTACPIATPLTYLR
jgi:curved DNA-binding protein CbpA